MKIRVGFVCLMLLFVSAGAEDLVVPIVDKSDSGSPLENEGNITLSEMTNYGTSIRSHKDQWTVRNKSHKPIITIIETLRIRYASGHIKEVKNQYEAFFGPTLLKPGDAVSFSDNASGNEFSKVTQNSNEPICEVLARWVQFADGSTWGDVAYAEELLKTRAAILNQLKQLDTVYKTQGLEQFALQLQQRVQPDVDVYLGHLRKVQLSQGTQAAIDELEDHLRFADAKH
jgi:hypothetical protein